MVRTLLARHELPLGAGDVVVRSGSMPRTTLTKAAADCFRQFGVYGISVAAGPDLSVDDLYRASRRLRLDDKHRVSTVGTIDALPGYELRATGAAPHYTLVIPGPVDDTVWEALTGAFGPVETAPQWGT